MRPIRNFLIVQLLTVAPALAQPGSVLPGSYDVVWGTQSHNSSESMPCGGGSIGLNVWVENNELLMYMSKSDAFDENNGLQKAGRVRLRFDPDPFEGAQFSQVLMLNDGYITIVATKEHSKAEMRVWVDVFRPVIHIDVESTLPVTTTAIYESWRTETFKERPGENFQNSYKWAPFDTIYTYRDSVAFHGSSVLFFHRNRDYSVFDANVHLQGLDNVKSRLFNPIRDLTFGGEMEGAGMTAGETNRGRYVNTDFKGWSIRSRRPARRQPPARRSGRLPDPPRDGRRPRLRARKIAHRACRRARRCPGPGPGRPAAPRPSSGRLELLQGRQRVHPGLR